MRPTINSSKPVQHITTITIIVALFLSLDMFNVQASIYLYTLQNSTKLAFSVKTFPNPKMQSETPVLNKIWYYRMHKESSQVVPE